MIQLETGMVWYGMVWFGLVWFGLVWFGLFNINIWLGIALSLAQLQSQLVLFFLVSSLLFY